MRSAFCIHFDTPEGQVPPPTTPIFTVPFPRDSDFIDRGDVLDQVRSRLLKSAARVALVGLGGVG